MDTSISRLVRAQPLTIFRLAAQVEDWPRLLPHYRWVRVLSQTDDRHRTVDMAARRDVFGNLGVPLPGISKSITSSATGSKNIPLIVKSRRFASSSGEEKRTETGRLPST